MKKPLSVAGRILAVVAAVVVVAPWLLGFLIAGSIRTIAPQILGVPVKVGMVSLSALTGRVEVRGFEIGNPEGFDTPYLLHSKQLLVDLHVRDLLRGQTHIEEVRVIGPRVWYHRKLTSSNVSTLLDGLDSRAAADKDAEKAKDKEKEKKGKKGKDAAKPVVIDHFLFDEGTVGVKVGAGVEVPLAKVELRDIGKNGAFMPVQIVRVVLGAVFDSVLHAVSAVGGAAVDAVGGAAGAAADAVGNAAGSLIKGAKSILGGD